MFRGVAQPGSAPVLGTGGPRFESWCPDRLRASPKGLALFVGTHSSASRFFDREGSRFESWCPDKLESQSERAGSFYFI